MYKIVKMSLVALVMVAAVVGNTVAVPRQGGEPCSPAESQALQEDVIAWAIEVVVESPSVDEAAEGVFNDCDTDEDGSLSAAEFVACIKDAVDDSSISDACFDYMTAAGDANNDGSVGVEELKQLFNMAAASTKKQKRSARNSIKRQDPSPDCSAEDSTILQTAVTSWLKSFLNLGKTPSSVAKYVKTTCDTNSDDTLTADEFVGCLETELSNFDISDACFNMLLQYADQSGDKVIDEEDLLKLVNLVAAS